MQKHLEKQDMATKVIMGQQPAVAVVLPSQNSNKSLACAHLAPNGFRKSAALLPTQLVGLQKWTPNQSSSTKLTQEQSLALMLSPSLGSNLPHTRLSVR